MAEFTYHRDYTLPNVWLGTSIEDQATADERIPHLLQCPAAVRWVSIEPQLAHIDVANWLTQWCSNKGPDYLPWRVQILDWIVCGSESGPGARPFDPDWARSLRDQCAEAGVPFFMKQLCDAKGHKIPFTEFPKDLQVREWPKGYER